MSRVPTGTQTVTVTKTRDLMHNINKEEWTDGSVIIGDTYEKVEYIHPIVATDEEFIRITSINVDSVSGLSDDSKVSLSIYSNNQIKFVITNFNPRSEYTIYVQIRYTYTYTVRKTQTVFKVKFNGKTYDKIKLNGTVITPKA